MRHMKALFYNVVQAAVVTDPALVAIVLDKASGVDKNSKNVYAKMNVVRQPPQ